MQSHYLLTLTHISLFRNCQTYLGNYDVEDLTSEGDSEDNTAVPASENTAVVKKVACPLAYAKLLFASTNSHFAF